MKKLLKLIKTFIIIICFVCCFFMLSCKNNSYTKYENIAYGDYERQTFNLFLPDGRTGTVGLILVIHGGGWVGGDKEYYNKKLDGWCKEYGVAAASINYHYISCEFSCDDIIDDIALSLEKIKEFALTKGVNIEKVLLTGNSAGGHLSLLYAYKYANRASIKPVAVANYSGPTDLTDVNYYINNENASGYLDLFSRLCHTTFTFDNYLDDEMQEILLEYSPINYVNESTVPTIICHGDEDDIVPYSNGVTLKEKLNMYGVKSDFVSYSNSGHSLSGDKKSSKKAKKIFASYVNDYLK